MQKKLRLLIICSITFSFNGFAQTAEKSEHPLLDKYYPHPESPDTNKAITGQIKTPTQTRSAASASKMAGSTVKPTLIVPPPADDLPTTAVSGVSSSPAVSAPTVVTNAPIHKPVAPAAPVKMAVQPAPPVLDTRLGSSTPQYDTWEKNSNGAGSVTTRSK